MVLVKRFYFKILCAESKDNAQKTKIWNAIIRIYFTQNLIESKINTVLVRSHDIKEGGCDVHLSPQIHQEYIYKWNISHRALAEQ